MNSDWYEIGDKVRVKNTGGLSGTVTVIMQDKKPTRVGVSLSNDNSYGLPVYFQKSEIEKDSTEKETLSSIASIMGG